jgi:hypothetical protein
MCIIAWFWFFVAVFFAICAVVLGSSDTRKREENKRIKRINEFLVKKTTAFEKQLEFYQNKERKEAFFDFEKVNGKKEK